MPADIASQEEESKPLTFLPDILAIPSGTSQSLGCNARVHGGGVIYAGVTLSRGATALGSPMLL